MRKTKTQRLTSMIALRLCWPIFAIWYVCQPATPHLVSAQTNDRKFKIVSGVRYGSKSKPTELPASSMEECAVMCVNEQSCSNFNFGSGQCELLLISFCKTDTPGWTHGYNPTGKNNQHRENPLVESWLSKTMFTV